MALPRSKQELADWILRRLGAPVVNVEIADVQLEDCIDKAVQWFQEWHYDGSARSYRTIKLTDDLISGNHRIHQNITADPYDQTIADDYRVGKRVLHNDIIYVKTDSDSTSYTSFDDALAANIWIKEDAALNQPDVDVIVNQAGQVGIPLPDNIISVSKVFKINSAVSTGMWNYEYQYFMTHFDMFYGNGGTSSMPLTNYYITKTYLDMIDNLMNTQPAIRFNKHKNRLFIDTDWKKIAGRINGSKDYYFLAEVYEVADPESNPDVYKDMWLKDYAVAQAKMQWGSNLKKYTNTELPGGLTLDGQALYDEGKEEALALEEELKTSSLEMDSIILG